MSSRDRKSQDTPDKDQLERVFEYYPRLRNVKEYVEAHLDESITLQDAARVATLEPKYFSQFFRAKTSVRFTEWLRGIRIRRAKQMIEKSNQSLTSVAFEVGYQNLSTFQRSFKREIGVTASEYKRSIRPD